MLISCAHFFMFILKLKALIVSRIFFKLVHLFFISFVFISVFWFFSFFFLENKAAIYIYEYVWDVFKKLIPKLNLPKQKWTINETLICFNINPLEIQQIYFNEFSTN